MLLKALRITKADLSYAITLAHLAVVMLYDSVLAASCNSNTFKYKAVYASGAVKEEEVTPFIMRQRGCMFYPLGKVVSPENKRERPITLYLPKSLIGDTYLDYKFFLYSLNPRYEELGGYGVVYR